jgi:hypothetical protein
VGSQPLFARIILALVGLYVLGCGLALLFEPRWFFANVGFFPPFNRHYSGDLGAFLVPIGAGLLYAARDPSGNQGVVAVALVGSVLHTFNHLYDAVAEGGSVVGGIADVVPLALGTLLLASAYYQVAGGSGGGGGAKRARAR